MAWSCAANAPVQVENEPPRPAPEQAPQQTPERWGDIRLYRQDPFLGQMLAPYGSTLHTAEDVAFEVELRQSVFVRVVNVAPSGKTAFEKDLGRVMAPSRARIPADPRAFLRLDSALGTEYVVLMLSVAPLEPAAVESLTQSVLRAERAPVSRGPARKHPKPKSSPEPKPEQATEPAAAEVDPYRELDLSERGLTEGHGRYLEMAGGERAVTWIRFEHRPRERR
ncbi:MAG: hypothetical protein M3020_22485 [Myxococcota bacterium]|nr:hypothetical protein [Myxococcota bacterium]